MAQDDSVEDALEAPDHAIAELLLDALRLTEVDLFYKEDVSVRRVVQKRSNFLIELVAVPDEQTQLAHVAFEEFASHSGAHGSCGTGKKHTFAGKLALEVERWQILLRLLFDLGDGRCWLTSRCCVRTIHSEKVLHA